LTEGSTVRLADELATQIRQLVVTDNIPEGARLPSERDLAERFGSSRPTVSQALRTLSLMGLVEIRRGSGAYVIRRPESMVTASVSLMLDQDGQSVADLMQLRLWLELLGVEGAATREPHLTPGEVEGIETSLQRLVDVAGDAAAWIAADTVFHANIVRSAGNAYLAAMYESVHTAVLSFEFKHWIDRDTLPNWLLHAEPAQQLALHEPIADSVIQRNVAEARVAVLSHHRVMVEHLASDQSEPGAAPNL
jgi:GntR family transcriptional repressor for pyruvate dehydrogenase complex